VRAWPQVLAQVPEARLLMAGEGPYRPKLQRLAESLGVSDSVVFTGAVEWGRMPAHIDAGDVFAMPSRGTRLGLEVEGLGIVALEAAACGLPVLVGNSGGAPDSVRDGKTGHVVDSRDPFDVARRIVPLVQDRRTAGALGNAGREWVTGEWTWDASFGVLRRVLEL